jgi:hypothetical protein
MSMIIGDRPFKDQRLADLERIRAGQALALLQKENEIAILRTKLAGLGVLARVASMTDDDI